MEKTMEENPVAIIMGDDLSAAGAGADVSPAEAGDGLSAPDAAAPADTENPPRRSVNCGRAEGQKDGPSVKVEWNDEGKMSKLVIQGYPADQSREIVAMLKEILDGNRT